MSTKKAVFWLFFWVALALVFDAGIYVFMGQERALEFLGGFVIEKCLSLDNLFLFILIFSSFGIEPKYQRKVLNYGIIGAMVLRLVFILLGVTIVTKFHWVLYVFGALLIYSGIKMLVKSEENEDIEDSKILKLLGKIVPISDTMDGEKFFTKKNGVRYITPLLAILILVEGSDVIFAIDSIPAIFSITTDLFIVYTSNVFAILGLRNLYFIVEKLHSAFRFVKYGVAFILIFTGLKLSLLLFHIEIPMLVSLIIILTLLSLSVFASIIIKENINAEYQND